MPNFKQFMVLDMVSKTKSPVFKLAALKRLGESSSEIALYTSDNKVFYTKLIEKFILAQEVQNG